jgi:hypothetical protein
MAKSDNLFLILKSEWYWMIAYGIKKEEYREFNSYWYKRLIEDKDFKTVTFQLGYTKKHRMVFEVKDIVTGIGNKDWGATGDKTYIIKLGKQLQ